jgi:CubicO group peptidase (beta-lactamase class C family)
VTALYSKAMSAPAWHRKAALPAARVAPPRPGWSLFLVVVAIASAAVRAIPCAHAQPALLERARALELDTAYVPPPGYPLQHHTAGFAKIVCSAVFVSGFDAQFAARNLGYFVSPLDERAKVGEPVIDATAKRVSIRMPDGKARVAVYLGDQGCVTLPPDGSLHFTPQRVAKHTANPVRTPWPAGDLLTHQEPPPGIDQALLRQVLDAAFEPAGMTAAFVVTWKGRIIAERYGENVTPHTPLESWSMGKSLTATLLGRLMQQGVYRLAQPAPIPQWQGQGDPRSAITIADLLHMSSGLRIRAPQDPDYDPNAGYPDHVYLYTGGIDAFHYAATRPLQWPPGAVGRYRNTDPVLINYLIRLALEQRGEDYLSFPQRALFDQLGIRNLIIETDPYGNFLGQGYVLGAARDWARLGNLYLQDGVWNGERLLPEGFVDFVSRLAPAWQADGRPIYGGFFWLNGDGRFAVPENAYFMAGAGGQYTLIVPSHDLVVVRMGHYRGQNPGTAALNQALALLMRAVPASR